ncbi:MAG: branched-chain amino acid ABC transporter permease [Synergistaceae bacterium]|nr:branched-chain amino acid ABC transporter permease [Synergistaceae bacterium]
MQLFFEQILNGLAIGSIYALITLGLALVYGILRILHVAHAAVYTVGAYVGLAIYSRTSTLLLAVPGSMLSCVLLGIAIERFVYFPLLKYPPYVPLISSIALFLGLEELCRIVAGPELLTFPATLPFPSFSVAGVMVSGTTVTVYAVTIAVLAALWFVTAKTEFGLAMRAASLDMEVASSLGVNSKLVVDATFAIGSAIASLAGILVGIYYNQVYSTMGTMPAYKSLALIVVGGMGSTVGTVLASFLLGLGETLLISFANIPLPRDALAFIAMILVLMWKPTGLLGKR